MTRTPPPDRVNSLYTCGRSKGGNCPRVCRICLRTLLSLPPRGPTTAKARSCLVTSAWRRAVETLCTSRTDTAADNRFLRYYSVYYGDILIVYIFLWYVYPAGSFTEHLQWHGRGARKSYLNPQLNERTSVIAAARIYCPIVNKNATSTSCLTFGKRKELYVLITLWENDNVFPLVPRTKLKLLRCVLIMRFCV